MEVLTLHAFETKNSVTRKPWFDELDYIGNVDLMRRPMLAMFSSAKCPASLILRAHDYARKVRDSDIGIISGFHAPAEKEILQVLLKGTCPIIVVLGRRLENSRLPVVWRAEIRKGRMLIISPFKEYQRQIKKEMALKRNNLAAEIADRVLVIHASERGRLVNQLEHWKSQGICIENLA